MYEIVSSFMVAGVLWCCIRNERSVSAIPVDDYNRIVRDRKRSEMSQRRCGI